MFFFIVSVICGWQMQWIYQNMVKMHSNTRNGLWGDDSITKIVINRLFFLFFRHYIWINMTRQYVFYFIFWINILKFLFRNFITSLFDSIQYMYISGVYKYFANKRQQITYCYHFKRIKRICWMKKSSHFVNKSHTWVWGVRTIFAIVWNAMCRGFFSFLEIFVVFIFSPDRNSDSSRIMRKRFSQLNWCINLFLDNRKRKCWKNSI